ncbi:hypothetical protein SDD30_02555 [Moorella naiadis]|uniref:quinate 5-dehydrogenase n=1 Tax=Moorella naiadis (nom. illeg.) TaxID=3093670 RepID=UPI003D9CB3BB
MEGAPVFLKRYGCNGQPEVAARLLRELDGWVDALGLGGVNLFYHLAGKDYSCPLGQYLACQVRKTPLVDGSGWKRRVEITAVDLLPPLPAGSPALVVSVLDRFWLAQALQQAGYVTLAGDAAFGLKLPLAVSLPTFTRLGYLAMPLLARLPLAYLYPLGPHQEHSRPRFQHLYARARIIAGNWHFIRRNLPWHLNGQVFITSGTTPADRELLARRGASRLVTTTPTFQGISPAANALEAVLVALGAGEEEYLHLARKLNWLPRMIELDPASTSSSGE